MFEFFPGPVIRDGGRVVRDGDDEKLFQDLDGLVFVLFAREGFVR